MLGLLSAILIFFYMYIMSTVTFYAISTYYKCSNILRGLDIVRYSFKSFKRFVDFHMQKL